METIKTHNCKRAFEIVKVVKFKNEAHWSLNIPSFDIRLYFIDYCPYCGVKLSYE